MNEQRDKTLIITWSEINALASTDQHPRYDVLQVDSCGEEIAMRKTNFAGKRTHEMHNIFVYYAVIG